MLEQPFGQLQRINRPEALGPRTVDAGPPGLGSAVQNPVDPLGGYGLQIQLSLSSNTSVKGIYSLTSPLKKSSGKA